MAASAKKCERYIKYTKKKKKKKKKVKTQYLNPFDLIGSKLCLLPNQFSYTSPDITSNEEVCISLFKILHRCFGLCLLKHLIFYRQKKVGEK